ncbi:MAG: CerR family C-terminal domain-containing protein [Rhizobiaceae bacterium]|nr:CerR family C-terminal domain-containing protein [Rhizobiaceae bacterium]MCV0406064.1 CerR family C-terminal domain-containing protein [Rhizobiaceae bacterium]
MIKLAADDGQGHTGTQAGQGGAEATRLALIMAGLRLFGRQGYDATSTRELAAVANANIGSIAYHFGGKEGLRAACAQHIVDTIRAVAGPAVGLGDTEELPSEQAEQRLIQGLQRIVAFMVARPEAGEFVQFVLRELSTAGAGVDILYNGVFEPVHKRLCQLWGHATGQPAESERTRIAVFAMIGQVVYFRIGREAVMRRMGWDNIGPAEAAKITAVFTENLEASLKAHREAEQ